MTMSAGNAGAAGTSAAAGETQAGGGSAAGQHSGRGYAGDVDPRDAWQVLRSEPAAMLVDVRSSAEWTFVGLPDLRSLDKQVVLVAWQDYPGMVPNATFVSDLKAQLPDPAAPVFFLCRSGARSRAAAIAGTAAGLAACYNVAGGFEGNLDAEGHRGTQDGWKAAGLPWMQS